MSKDSDAVRNWWRTSIIDMEPGRIAFRGHPIEDLVGNVSFGQMIWLMTRGALPTSQQAALLECALVAGVDHGPQAPSIAAARMAATCGVGLNNVMATGVNMLGDVHGALRRNGNGVSNSRTCKSSTEEIQEADEAISCS